MSLINKIIRLIFIIVILYFMYIITTWIYWGHSANLKNYFEYTWLFKDSVNKDIDTTTFFSAKGRKDILLSYSYKQTYYIKFWKFKDFGEVDLKTLNINTNKNLDDIDFSRKETLNIYSWPLYIAKLGFSVNKNINVNLDPYSTLIRQIETKKYKGFYGILNQISLSDEQGNHFIIIYHNVKKEPTIFLFYPKRQDLYVILVNSIDTVFDEKILDILNLE